MENTGSLTDADCYRLYDNLEIGIAVFKGCDKTRIRPVFCNKAYSALSGFTFEQFISGVVKDTFYCVHPDDMCDARRIFSQCYETGEALKHSLRVKAPNDKDYRYIAMTGKIKHADDGTYEYFLVFDEVSSEYGDRLIMLERYNNLIQKAEQNAVNTLVTVWFNVTKDTCAVLHRALDVKTIPTADKSIDEFIISSSSNITEEKIRTEFIQTNKRDVLTAYFEQGFLQKKQQLPVRLASNRIMWCEHKIVLTRNPDTKDLECVMTLTEDDKSMRIQKAFGCLMKHDYDTIANMNIHTGLVTVLNVSNSRGIIVTDHVFYHQDFLQKAMESLVPEEFAPDAIQALQLETIKEALKTQELYVVTFPAKKQHEADADRVYQWRLGYVDESKDELLFTRREMLGFLDTRQKVELVQSELQQQANEIAASTKEGKAKRNKILIADDSDINREMLSIIFEDKFTILEACDGEEAITLIDKNHQSIALILLDMQMPKKTGLDVLIHLKMRNLTALIPTMLVTGSTSKEMGLRSLEFGINDIVNKPFDSKIVKRRALNLIELYAHKEEVENQLNLWKQDALQLHEKQEKNDELLINALSSVVEFRSVESGTHVRRVRALTKIMLETWMILEPEVALSESDIEEIARASTLHDIGKVAIPDNILLKPGRLTPEEFDIMKTHTTLGCQMLEQFKQDDSDFYTYCYDICRYHHERADGRGYPDGLNGDEIPFWAQIVSIVDVYDALISPRVYKAAFTSEKAIEMIQNGECGVFSPRLLTVFGAAKETIISESEKMAER